MNCEQVRNRFSPYLNGDLKDADHERIADHLRTCRGCANRFSTLREGLGALRDLPRHPVPRSFAQDVLEQLSDEGFAPRDVATDRRDVWIAAGRWAAGILLGITVCLVSMRVLRRAEPEPGMASSGAHLAVLERVANLVAGLREEIALGQSVDEQQNRELEETRRRSDDSARTLSSALSGLKEEIAQLNKEQRSEANELAASVSARLGTLEKELSGWHRDSEGRFTILERDLETFVHEIRRSRRRDGAERAEMVSIETGKPIEHYYENGVLSWNPNPEHPGYIAALFRIYKGSDLQLRRRALHALDHIFAEATAEFAPRPNAIQKFLELESELDPDEAEGRRVAVYRDYWMKHVRGRK